MEDLGMKQNVPEFSLLLFLQSIEWRDPWLIGLVIFHVVVTLTAILTRNHGNFQVVLFLILLLLVYFSENINEVASVHWRTFSRQQYFDNKGLFISLVFSVPILLNCMIMVSGWLYQSSQLMKQLRQAQLRQHQRRASPLDPTTPLTDTTPLASSSPARLKTD